MLPHATSKKQEKLNTANALPLKWQRIANYMFRRSQEVDHATCYRRWAKASTALVSDLREIFLPDLKSVNWSDDKTKTL